MKDTGDSGHLPAAGIISGINDHREYLGWPENARFFGRVDWKARRRFARELLDRIGGKFDPETTASELSMPEQQLVEIARALGANARILFSMSRPLRSRLTTPSIYFRSFASSKVRASA